MLIGNLVSKEISKIIDIKQLFNSKYLNMQNNNTSDIHSEDEINVMEILSAVWEGRIFLGTIVGIFALFSVLYALSLPNLYTSSSLLMKAEEQGSSAPMQSQVGGFAALAGIDMGGGGGKDKTTLAIATLESRDFLKHLLSFDGIKEGLMAAKSYDPATNELQYEDADFNSITKTWIREPGLYETVIPSALEVYDTYRQTLSASLDKKTGFVNVSSTHISPIFAHDFLALVIQEVNQLSRIRDLQESEEALKYLELQLETSKNLDINLVINQLIESQLKTQMLANVRPDYLLQVLDRPYVPILKSSPQRSIICIFGTLMGLVLGMVLILGKYFFFTKPSKSSLSN
jgi:hypothetical protein|tara:strand:+ start:582 stop:1616 length:1035 start_codon:yes stop_codon:yes gene_type:complete